MKNILQCDHFTLDLSKPKIMGVLNVTPNSFYDGGVYLSLDKAIRRAAELVSEGADIIDVGGESTRPGAVKPSVSEEIDRVIPVIESIKQFNVPISVDTSRPEVIQAAVETGANFINDVRALQLPGAIEMAAQSNLPVCLMHMQGTPESMQNSPTYKNVVKEVGEFLQQRIDACVAAGIKKENIIIDPGFGFGKSVNHNLVLLKSLKQFQQYGHPVLVGLSRKSLIGYLLNQPDPSHRLPGSLALAVIAALNGANIIRCHDVKDTLGAVQVAMAVHHAKDINTFKEE